MESVDGEDPVPLWLCRPKHGAHSQSSPLGRSANEYTTMQSILTWKHDTLSSNTLVFAPAVVFIEESSTATTSSKFVETLS